MNRKLKLAACFLLGLIYFVFGLNGFLNFIPKPPTMPEGATQFMVGMTSAAYFFPVLKGTEVIGGLMLLTGFGAPAALVILAPITLQIALFHGFLTPGLQNLILPIFMIVLHVTGMYAFCDLYRPLFSRRPCKHQPEVKSI